MSAKANKGLTGKTNITQQLKKEEQAMKKNKRSNGNKFSGSSQRKAVLVAGKQYPFERGAIQMTLADAESFSLADFPQGSIVEFRDTEDLIHVRAIQKITGKSAEVVLIYRAAANHPVCVSDKVFREVAKGLITAPKEHERHHVL
jgi:hypothetical protein